MNNLNNNETLDGSIQIADNVIATIIEASALEVEGVHSILTKKGGSFKNKKDNQYTFIEIIDGIVNIDLKVILVFGFNVKKVSESIQEKVSSAIETMSGLEVGYINISIEDIVQK